MNKKQVKLIFKEIIDFYQELIKKIKNSFDLPEQKEMLEPAIKILKSNTFKTAYKVFLSNNQETIQNYLNSEFQNLPLHVQKLIYYKTTELTIDNKSIYDKFLNNESTAISLFNKHSSLDPLEATAMTEISKLKHTAIKNLLKADWSIDFSYELFDLYLDSFTFTSVDDFINQLFELSQINHSYVSLDGEIKQHSYISQKQYYDLFEKFFKEVKSFDIQEFYTKLKYTEEKSDNLKKLFISSDVTIYKYYFDDLENPYETFKLLIQDENIKKNFYEPDGFRYFLNLVSSYPIEESLKYISDFIKNDLFIPDQYTTDMLLKFLYKVDNKDILLNFDLTMPIYEKLVISDETMPIAQIFAKQRLTRQQHQVLKRKFSISEADFLSKNEDGSNISLEEKREKIKFLIKSYHDVGIIDFKTYEDILNIAQKYNKNITFEKLCEIIKKNNNLKNICEYIAMSSNTTSHLFLDNLQELGFENNEPIDTEYPRDVTTNYEKFLFHLKTIFPKTRLQSLPEIEAFKKMSISQLENFNVKVWNQFASLPLFSEDSTTKQALVEFIAIMGLFENDEMAESRRKLVYKLANEFDERITFAELEISMIQSSLILDYNELDKSIREKLEHQFPIEGSALSQLRYNPFKGKGYNLTRFFDPCKVKKLRLNPYCEIPESIQHLFRSRREFYISHQTFNRYKNQTGSTGKILNDFLSPYAKEGSVYKLKRNVQIPEHLKKYLTEQLSEEEFNKFIKEGSDALKMYDRNQLSSEDNLTNLFLKIRIAGFLSPITEFEVDAIKPKPNLPSNLKQIINHSLLLSDLAHRLNIPNVHKMFDGCEQKFDKKFYEFLMQNFYYFLENQDKQSYFKDIQKYYEQALAFYKEKGNPNPSIEDIFDYIEKAPFAFNFGLDEFAQQVRASGVKSQDKYNFYQNLLPAMQSRKKTTIPRHNKTYIYVDKDGKEYKVMTKILRLDDPMNMLVGESNFSDCCQVYQKTGESCMNHASTSENGGILAIYIVGENGVPEMLTQSWIWTNESKLCLDNVESTNAIKDKHGDTFKLFQDIATFGIIQAANDILKTSKESIENYITTQTKKIMSSKKLTDEEKQTALKQLEILRARQTLKIITVGEGYDDLRVKETFEEKESPENSHGPKNYFGYRDSINQRIVAKSNEPVTPIDDNYHDIPIYRDDRRVAIQKGSKITHSMLKHITEIETIAHKQQMVHYKDNDKPILTSVSELSNVYGCNDENLHILAGEDWYYIYSDNGETIEILDFAKKEPKIEDEGHLQQTEMRQAFNTILAQSVVVDESGTIKKIKTLNADMREDTSYLLYLYQKQRGIISQVGQDYIYKFGKENSSTIFSEEEQEKLLKSARQIMQEENPNMLMHKISFVPSQKTIEKIINNALSNLSERSLK